MKALLVIDVQNGVYSWEGIQVLGGEPLLRTIASLIASARGAGSPVVFVQHRDESLVEGSEAFDLVDALDARAGDIRVVKEHGSALHGTGLGATLRDLGADHLVICGLQTEFCVDSTVRHAHALDFDVTLVADAHSTFDSEVLRAERIVAHHNRTLASYASVVGSDEVTFRD